MADAQKYGMDFTGDDKLHAPESEQPSLAQPSQPEKFNSPWIGKNLFPNQNDNNSQVTLSTLSSVETPLPKGNKENNHITKKLNELVVRGAQPKFFLEKTSQNNIKVFFTMLIGLKDKDGKSLGPEREPCQSFRKAKSAFNCTVEILLNEALCRFRLEPIPGESKLGCSSWNKDCAENHLEKYPIKNLNHIEYLLQKDEEFKGIISDKISYNSKD